MSVLDRLQYVLLNALKRLLTTPYLTSSGTSLCVGFESLFLFELEVDPCIQYRPLTLRRAGRESRWSGRGK